MKPGRRSTITSVPSTILIVGTRPSVTSVRWTTNGNTLPERQHSGTVYGIGSAPLLVPRIPTFLTPLGVMTQVWNADLQCLTVHLGQSLILCRSLLGSRAHWMRPSRPSGMCRTAHGDWPHARPAV